MSSKKSQSNANIKRTVHSQTKRNLTRACENGKERESERETNPNRKIFTIFFCRIGDRIVFLFGEARQYIALFLAIFSVQQCKWLTGHFAISLARSTQNNATASSSTAKVVSW